MLLDTCILIDYTRNHPDAVAFVEGLPGQIPICMMTIVELYGGVREGKERRQLEALLSGCEIYEIERRIAAEAGLIYRQYHKSHGLDAIDAIIAATALVHDLQLVTNNRKHFPMVKKLLVPYAKSKR